MLSAGFEPSFLRSIKNVNLIATCFLFLNILKMYSLVDYCLLYNLNCRRGHVNCSDYLDFEWKVKIAEVYRVKLGLGGRKFSHFSCHYSRVASEDRTFFSSPFSFQ